MAFGKKKGQRGTPEQSGGGERRRFVGREDLMRFFAQFADEAESLTLRQTEIEAAVDSGGRKDIERPTDDVAFRSALTNLRTQIGDGLRKKGEETGLDWFGPFDGWFKSYANEAYGPETDFAKEHGDEDWTGKMIYIVLPGQVSKHNVLAKWAAFAGMPLVETRQSFKPIYEAVVQRLKAGAPKRADFKSSSAHLEAAAGWDQSIGYFRRTRRDVEDWLKGKKDATSGEGGATPPEDSKVQFRKDIEGYRGRIVELRRQLAEKTIAGAESAVLSGIMGSIMGVEKDLSDAEARLAELEGTKDGAQERLERTANVVVDEPQSAGEPMGIGPRVEGDPEGAKAKAGDATAKIEAYLVEIERLNSEIASHEAAVNEKEAEAVKKSVAGRAETDDEKAEEMLRQARVLRQSAKDSAVSAEKLQKKAEAIRAEVTKLKAVMKSAEAAKPKKSRVVKVAAPPVMETPPPAVADAPPTPTGDPKVDVPAQYAYWLVKGNTAMVKALEPAVKAMAG